MALLGLMAIPQPTRTKAHAQSERPNVLIIMTDDQGHDTLTDQFMPNTKAMIADQGINFTRAYTSTALCCPSRASFLTGKYARNHGVHVNGDTLNGPTIANRLRGSGYYTGLVGKYLNSWPGDARPEYDYWACWKQGYRNPQMNIYGEDKKIPGYATYVLRDYAVDFLNSVPDNQPFFLLFTPHAPHDPATPGPGDEDLYSDLAPWRPPNFNPASQSDKPQWLQQRQQLSPTEVSENVDEFRLKQLRTLHSADLSVRDILNKLREQGKLDNTLVVFYSDNGVFWGEHRLLHKNHVYEEASRIPFAIRYPLLIAQPRVEDRLIQVVDLAPTMYELAGISIPSDVDGRSLVSLMSGTTDWRDAILLEGWPGTITSDGALNGDDAGREADDQQNVDIHYKAIRTEQYVYVETDNDSPELYDTIADPYQMVNLVNNRKLKKIVKSLRKRLRNGQL